MTRGVLCVLLCSFNFAAPPLALSASMPPDMVLIPPGEFIMGTPDGSDGLADEHPERRVYLSGFFLDRFEVTNAAYFEFTQATNHRAPENANPSATLWAHGFPLPQVLTHPVVNVSWEDATAYCLWTGKRLPTEAEWEKAARGTDGRRYPWGNEWDLTKANSASYWAGRTIEFRSGADWDAFWLHGDGARRELIAGTTLSPREGPSSLRPGPRLRVDRAARRRGPGTLAAAQRGEGGRATRVAAVARPDPAVVQALGGQGAQHGAVRLRGLERVREKDVGHERGERQPAAAGRHAEVEQQRRDGGVDPSAHRDDDMLM